MDQEGKPVYRCGFRIGGGIDQDHTKSPQGYPDKGVYITYIHEGGPAYRATLQVHDKVLQVGYMMYSYIIDRHERVINT